MKMLLIMLCLILSGSIASAQGEPLELSLFTEKKGFFSRLFGKEPGVESMLEEKARRQDQARQSQQNYRSSEASYTSGCNCEAADNSVNMFETKLGLDRVNELLYKDPLWLMALHFCESQSTSNFEKAVLDNKYLVHVLLKMKGSYTGQTKRFDMVVSSNSDWNYSSDRIPLSSVKGKLNPNTKYVELMDRYELTEKGSLNLNSEFGLIFHKAIIKKEELILRDLDVLRQRSDIANEKIDFLRGFFEASQKEKTNEFCEQQYDKIGL